MSIEKIIVPENVFLEIVEGYAQGTTFKIDKKSMIIGRDEICDIKIEDEYVSKRHCQIVFRTDHFTIIDLNSLNKTKVNEKIYIQKNLKNKDIITLGRVKLEFNWETMDETKIDSTEDIEAKE